MTDAKATFVILHASLLYYSRIRLLLELQVVTFSFFRGGKFGEPDGSSIFEKLSAISKYVR